jgi:eukaryotic-like serine/threonine-protein kinase
MSHSKSSLILSLTLIISAISNTARAVDEWPTFHHDPALTGCSTSSSPDTNAILWIYNTNSAGTEGIKSSPAISGNVLYIGCSDWNLYALNAIDGNLIWKFKADGEIYSSPAVSEGMIYFLSEAGTFYALNTAKSLIWKESLGDGPWDYSSPVIHDGNVFVASSTGVAYSLNAKTGAFNWSIPVGGTPDGPLAVVNGKVYCGTHTNSPTLIALDENTGGIKWQYNGSGFVNCNGPAVVDGDGDGQLEVYFGVYASDTVGWTVCLHESDGSVKWIQNIGGSHSTPAVHNGNVFIGCEDKKVYELDASSGSIINSYLSGGQVWSAPAIADGKVFFGSLDHIVYAISEANCGPIWKYYTSASRIMGSPAIAHGNVYVGNENGKIYAFGKTQWKISKTADVNTGDCVSPGRKITYTITYDANGVGDSNVHLVDYVPLETDYNSSSPQGDYNAVERIATWNLGTVPPGGSGTITLKVNVNNLAEPNGTITNVCEFMGDHFNDSVLLKTPVCCWNSGVIYVDANAPGHNNGLSWQDAYQDLQKALERARRGCGSQIWVAKGTYIPTAQDPCNPDIYHITFRLINGIPIYGHFTGNETSINQRNLNDPNNETILLSNNYGYVVSVSGFSQNNCIDGFTITGDASIIDIENAYLKVANCIISSTYANSYGIYAYQSGFMVINCIIENAYGIYAGFNNNTTLPETLIENCTIHNTSGDGIRITNARTPITILNNIINNNYEGIYLFNCSPPPVISKCKIFSNSTYGIFISSSGTIILNNWIYRNNTSGVEPTKTGIYLGGSIDPKIIRNNTIFGNGQYGIYQGGGTAPVISTCSVMGNTISDLYGCSGNYLWLTANGDPCFVNADGNDFHLRPGSPCIDAGDPNFNDFNETDIDGEPRITDGDHNCVWRVDIGADELSTQIPTPDYNKNNIVNFIDFATFAIPWRSIDANVSLDADCDVDFYDLKIFCEHWLLEE